MTSGSTDRHYQGLESRWEIEEDSTYAGLVTPNGNGQAPFHRWFHMKEAFSLDLLGTVIADLGLQSRKNLSVCDPFSGSGTTLLSAAKPPPEASWRVTKAAGVEWNPYLHFLAQTRARALSDARPDFGATIKSVAERVMANEVIAAKAPRLSTFSNTRYFPTTTLRALLELRAAVEEIEDELERDLARVCLASIVEPVSSLRRDGRALRHQARKTSPSPVDAFVRLGKLIAEDVSDPADMSCDITIYRGDGRRISDPLKPGSMDLCLYSPPYPNNIDYSEVYKLEAWFLGLVGSPEDFRDLRRGTVRSHPSIKFDEDLFATELGIEEDFAEIVQPLLDEVPADRYKPERLRMIRGYVDDMLRTLDGLSTVVKPGGSVVYVVGNSLHGKADTTFVVASDLLIAAVAELAGFEVDRVAVARFPQRRATTSSFLRESVGFLTRPAT